MQRTTRLELEIGGKVRPLLFDHTFFDLLTSGGVLTDIDAIQVQKPWRYIPTLALAALQSAAEFESKKDKFTYEQVALWCGEVADPMTLNRIAEGYKHALGFIFHANMGRDIIAEAEAKAKAGESQ